MRSLAIAALLFVGACGGDPATNIGTSHAPGESAPVELTLKTPEGVFVDVGDLRGQVVLIFLFATFDGVSQAAVTPVTRFARHQPDVYVLGAAVQPNARELVDAWQAALTPPFVVTYSPEDALPNGTTDLGRIGTVPTFIFLDKRGRIAAQEVGIVSEARLERMADIARDRN